MLKSDFYYKSQDRQTSIHAIAWQPSGRVRAVLQICHGMVEYIDRYDDFARYLAEYGFYVVGNDHLGHGDSVVSDDRHGFFANPGGNECVIGDIHNLRKMTIEKFPDVPYFMLGHSMGSFLLRQYVESYGRGLTGAIIMGTGSQPGLTLKMGKFLCRLIALFRGWGFRSRMIDNMAFGSYNKAFEPARTPNDWLSKDTEKVDAYCAHPWCSFKFTVNGYFTLFRAVQAAQDKRRIAKIPKKLPLLVVSGDRDPVGANGKGVAQAYQLYKDAKIEDVEMRLYEGDRHEILNETDRDSVYADLLWWMKNHCPAEKITSESEDAIPGESTDTTPAPGGENPLVKDLEEKKTSPIDALAEDTLKMLRHM